jgi:hypothetical protein
LPGDAARLPAAGNRDCHRVAQFRATTTA